MVRVDRFRLFARLVARQNVAVERNGEKVRMRERERRSTTASFARNAPFSLPPTALPFMRTDVARGSLFKDDERAARKRRGKSGRRRGTMSRKQEARSDILAACVRAGRNRCSRYKIAAFPERWRQTAGRKCKWAHSSRLLN